jgi:hypothetical protein
MPSIDRSFLERHIQCDDLFQTYPICVETGTFTGKTIFSLEPHFETLHTIEIDKSLYTQVLSKYETHAPNLGRITFHLGDSSEVLKHLVPILDRNVVFFFDGHWSGGITGQGDKDCPLVEELNAIMEYFPLECILIIDDFRLFGTNIHEDWTDITKDNLMSIVQRRLQKQYHAPSLADPNDRWILHLGRTT